MDATPFAAQRHASPAPFGAGAAGRPGSVPLPVTPDQSVEAHRHPWLVIGIALLTGALLVMVLLGATVARGTQFDFDRAIMLSMREPGMPMLPEGPVWLKQAMIDITALGGETILTLVTMVTFGWLVLQRHLLTALLLAAGVISGSIAVGIAKTLVGRARPVLIDHLVQVDSASFPSGHSASSAIVYLTLAILLTQIVRSRGQRFYLLAVAVALVTAIGVSRVYLGVHWPSDVLAGWSFGTLWALAWWAIGASLRARYAGRMVPAPESLANDRRQGRENPGALMR